MSRVLALCLALIPMSLSAQTIVLYDELAGTLPAAQGWLTYITNLQGSATQSYVNNQGVNLVTDNQAQAGYFNKNPVTGTLVNPGFPSLSRTAGFGVRFNLSIASESHLNNDRAGFSVIALATDNQGIELGFWTNEIWAQTDTPLFTHGEGAVINTTNLTSYQLTILGNTYSLSANGSPLLTGPLRNYTSFGIPYTNNNFLFLGDDTTSAAANVTLGRLLLITSVPEPAVWVMLMVAVGLGIAAWLRWRRLISDCDVAAD